tara:strand:+ start:188 stop:607 length:420 start_codon:yes stop_codon:yes gene_type:complete
MNIQKNMQSQEEIEATVQESQPLYSKQELIQTVKKWVYLDNQIKQMSNMLKQLRKDKKKHNENMIDMMKANHIDNFELKDGQIQYKKYASRETLTQKRLLEILSNHPQLQSEQVEVLNEYIYENRRVVEKDAIVRKMKN